MHEFSTAVSIIEAIKRAAKDYGATKVTGITIQIGKLSMLNHDQLLFGLEIATKDSIVEGAKITIEPLPIKIRCNRCATKSIVNKEGALYEVLSSLTCPKCKARDIDIIQGRECVVKDIQAVLDEEN